MKQIELSVNKTGLSAEESEILTALLLEAGFESFEEDDSILRAFCSEDLFNSHIQLIFGSFPQIGKSALKFTTRLIPEKNWNEQWEKNFSPIVIDNRILVKANFHHIPNLEYTIIIEPKMSFGTGHHETTRLMLHEMLQLDLHEKEVLDMGCGTGVLGIAAKMMGASYVLAVDIDDWAFQNSIENFHLNNIKEPFDVCPGDSSVLEGHSFHVVLANINRNIILNDLPVYFNAIKAHGTLILSGILSVDRDAVLTKAVECGFTFVSSFYENNWISLNLKK